MKVDSVRLWCCLLVVAGCAPAATNKAALAPAESTEPAKPRLVMAPAMGPFVSLDEFCRSRMNAKDAPAALGCSFTKAPLTRLNRGAVTAARFFTVQRQRGHYCHLGQSGTADCRHITPCVPLPVARYM